MDQPTENAEALELIGIHRARLHELRKQEALFGATVDPSVPIQIRDIEQKIADLQSKTSQAVSDLGLPSSLMATGDAAGTAQPVAAANAPHPDLGAVAASLVPSQHVQAAAAALLFQGPALVLDPPAIQAWVGRRTETVAALLPDASGKTWFALHGIVSRGKTLLCRLLADSLGGIINWVSFAGLNDAGASALLERVCSKLTSQLPPAQRDAWYRAACQAMGAASVLALDDLPNLASSPQLTARLVPLIRSSADVGVRVLSSSLFTIPQSVHQELSGLIIDRAAPPFTDRDAEEVLAAFNAPAEIIRPAARLVNALARQHPTLLVAACRHLQDLNWVLAGGGLQGLLQGTYTNDIAAEVHQKLIQTVADGDTRQLLYRLSLADPFCWEDVDALADVRPPIDAARERLRSVINSWVEQRTGGKYAVAALLAQVVGDNLSGPVKRICHVALADLIFSRGSLDQHSALVAITHYCRGREFGKAGTTLCLVLHAALGHAEWIRDDKLMLLWTDTPLPVEMDLNVRLIVRGLHIGLFHELKNPLDFLFADFNALLDDATEAQRFGVAGAISIIATKVGRKYPMQVGAWLRRLFQFPAPAQQRQGGRRPHKGDKRPALELRDEFPIHVMIWILVGELTTPTHVRDWLDTLRALPPDVRDRAMTVDQAHVFCVTVADSLTGAEQKKPVTERNWPLLVDALTEFAERVRVMRCEILWACFVRAKITVQAELCRDGDGALATANQASQLASVNPIVHFLIDGTIGLQLLLAKRSPDARFWLRRAVERRAEAAFAYESANVLLGASHAFGVIDPELGVKYAVDATTTAESDDGLPTIDRVRAWCERGVAEFLASGAASAFSSWDRAGEYLFSTTERTDAWKELMVLFAHVTGYLAKLAETGQPPKQTRDGGEYAPPERGVFMTTNAARIAFFEERNEGLLWRALAYYADAVGDTGMSKKWMQRAAEVGRRDSLLALVAEAERDDIPKMVQEGNFSGALAAGRRSAQAMVVFYADTTTGGHRRVTEAEMPAAIARLSDDLKQAIEEYAMVIGLVPCVLSVATLAISVETRATVREHAEQLAAACRDLARLSLSAARWELTAELVERAYVRGSSSQEMYAWSKSIPGDQKDSFNMLLRLAACANATPDSAASAMLGFIPRLCKYILPRTSVYRELLVPFVVSYWTKKFEQQRFLFGRAMVVESQLASAVAAPEEERVVAVMRAIHAGFKFSGPMPDEVRRWLFG